MELSGDHRLHDSCMLYGINKLGRDSIVMDNVTLGFPSVRVIQEARMKDIGIDKYPFIGSTIGDHSIIRSHSVIYCDVVAGHRFKTGHNVVIREMTTIGENVLTGTNTVIDGSATIGNNVSIQSNVYIPTNTVIEDNVFLGPCSVLANDKYPIRVKYELKGPILRKGASVGANSTILPGVEIGEGAMVAAGALVTKDVPAWSMAIGFPARVVPMPDWLKNPNRI
jgi:acetyltransferase-like isoleucine patch superfamily enzyme